MPIGDRLACTIQTVLRRYSTPHSYSPDSTQCLALCLSACPSSYLFSWQYPTPRSPSIRCPMRKPAEVRDVRMPSLRLSIPLSALFSMTRPGSPSVPIYPFRSNLSSMTYPQPLSAPIAFRSDLSFPFQSVLYDPPSIASCSNLSDTPCPQSLVRLALCLSVYPLLSPPRL